MLHNIQSQLQKYLDGEVTSDIFEKEYCALWRNIRDENVILPSDLMNVLDELFIACDAYCDEESLRDSDDISEKELCESVKKAHASLIQL